MPLVEKTLFTNPRPSLADNNARPTPANNNPRPTQRNSNTRPNQENNLVIANNNARPTPANNNPRQTQGNSNTRPSRENNLVMSAPPVNNVVMTVPPPSMVDLEAEAVKKEYWVKNKPLVLFFRAVALFSSAVSFFVMVTTEGFTYYFTQDSTMCYVFLIVSMVMVYTAVFVGIHGHEIRTGDVVIRPKIAVWMNVFGDQILALLLVSGASTAGGLLSTRTYEGHIALSAALSTGMAFIAFLALEPAALISMYNFSAYRLKS